MWINGRPYTATGCRSILVQRPTLTHVARARSLLYTTLRQLTLCLMAMEVAMEFPISGLNLSAIVPAVRVEQDLSTATAAILLNTIPVVSEQILSEEVG